MKTETIVTRELLGTEVRQRHKSQLICANDIVKAGNSWRAINGYKPFNLQEYFRTKSTIEFMEHIEKEYGVAKMTGRGRSAGTWVNIYVAMDIALAISPALKLEVYQWITDELCHVRDVSGDSFKLMAGALWEIYPNKYEFSKFMTSVCERIKSALSVDDWNKAGKIKLEYRTEIHKKIALLCDVLKNPEDAVDCTLINFNKQLRQA